MTDDSRRRHLTPEEAAELRRRARERRGYAAGPSRGDAPRADRGARDEHGRPRSGTGAASAEGLVASTPSWRDRVGRPGYQPPQEPEPWVDDEHGARRPGGDPRDRREPLPPRRDPRDPGGPGRRGVRGGGYAAGRGDRSRPPRDPRAALPPRRRRRIRVLPVLALLLVAVVVLSVVTVFWADGKLTRIDALTDYPGRGGSTKGTTTLLVGTDGREGLTPEQQRQLSTGSEQDAGGKRTDSMMLAYSPADGGDDLLVSLPRDLLVTIPGYGQNKLNAAYAYGGPQLLVQTLEQQTGIRIDHYAEIGFGGFAGIVDAIGGVDICVEQPMDDPDAGINLAPGCQTLTGPQALGFVRSRHTFANQDLQRVKNQRIFLGALMKKATSPGVLLNPFTSLPLLDAGAKSMTVDRSDHIWNLAGLMWMLKGSPVTTTVPYDGEGSGDVGSYLNWGPSTEAFFASLKQGRTPPKELLQTEQPG